MKNKALGKKGKPGQSLLEFVLMFLIFAGMIVMLSLFLTSFKSYGGRVLDLVASEYP